VGPGFLVSDVDGTLLGDEAALEQFVDWFEQRRKHFRVAYSSGRFVDSIFESIHSTVLPTPEAVIGGVGTEIFLCDEQRMLSEWPATFQRWNAKAIRSALSIDERLEPQPEHLQSDYKVSFYAYHLAPVEVIELERSLVALGYEAQVVYSSHRDLDVLPAAANKGAAAEFLARYWDFPKERVIACGDSGNDAAMMLHGFCGVIVANAQEELHALQGPRIYHAKNCYAAGVLEGIEFWQSHQPTRDGAPGTPDPGAEYGRL